VTDRFQDGRRRHVENSSECYKMGNYHPILMQIGTQTKKNILSLEVTIPEVTIKFQDGRRLSTTRINPRISIFRNYFWKSVTKTIL
jgi:hypothetical protein